ncbi:MAG TPA: hypothetical protein VF459_16195 [Caulobacteraceae bacterium]
MSDTYGTTSDDDYGDTTPGLAYGTVFNPGDSSDSQPILQLASAKQSAVAPKLRPLIHHGPGRPLRPDERANIAAGWAENHVGKGGYGYYDPNDESADVPGGLNIRNDVFGGRWTLKCNKFVWDALKAAGTAPPPGPGGRILMAEDWGNPNLTIPGWRLVRSGEPFQRGDVMSNHHHVGIYAGDRQTVSAAARDPSNNMQGAVVKNGWGFRTDPHHEDDGMVVWRYDPQ